MSDYTKVGTWTNVAKSGDTIYAADFDAEFSALETAISSKADSSGTNNDGAQVFNESGAAVDFRIETEDYPYFFYIDGGHNTLTIADFDVSGADAGAQFNENGKLIISTDTGAAENVLGFYNTSGNVGNIITSGSSTSYSTTSDYRLKENVVNMTDAITRLKTLQPRRFNFIVDADTTLDGFVAHEVTAVPESIIGEKDAMIDEEVLYTQADEDKNEIPEGKIIGDVKEAARINAQGIDLSKLVPLLVGALQEAITRIETLENA